MRVIGVTGGVGAGKSTVLGILEEDFQAYVIQADQLGHILMEPGEECYDAVIALFGKEIIKKDKTIDRRRISDVVFTDKDMLLKLNGIIHPAVKQRILDLLGEQKEAGREICVVEAALFLEENYQEFCDEARNQLKGKIININQGAVNSIVSIDIGGGNIITATISCAAVEELGLKVGSDAYAVIKATNVMVGIDE